MGDERMAPKAIKETKDTSAKTVKAVKKPVETVFISKDDEYLLKYNIRDLEAAPWLHGGKRTYN